MASETATAKHASRSGTLCAVLAWRERPSCNILLQWVTHRLRDGSEYRLVYPYGAAGHLITLFSHAARSAYARRVTRNPQEAAEGMDSNVIPVDEIRIATSPDAGAILHLTTTDNVPIAVEVPMALLGDMAEHLLRVGESLRGVAIPTRQMH